jgi:hypothetical protein
MDLQLAITPRALSSSRGARVQPVVVGAVRDLELADLMRLEDPDRPRGETQILAGLRHSHHQLARLLASGVQPTAAASISGFALSRISILKDDPAFSELLEFYSAQTEDFRADMVQQLNTMSMDSLQVLSERVRDNPEEVTNNTLIELVKLGADRSGVGPSSTQQVEHTHILDQSDLDKLKQEVISGETNKRIDLSRADEGRTFVLKEDEVEGAPSPGDSV